jgi:hypothetical protein
MLRIELCPIEKKCKITAGMLYQLLSDKMIRKKKKMYTFEYHTTSVKNVVDAIFTKYLGPCRVVAKFNAVFLYHFTHFYSQNSYS